MADQQMAILVRDESGAVINIGEWDPIWDEEAVLNANGEPVLDDAGQPKVVRLARNPMPPGAVQGSEPEPIYRSSDGGLYTCETLASALRADRDGRLAASDWTQLADVPDSTTKAAWATYRQALRDLPTQPGWPVTVTWPVAPG